MSRISIQGIAKSYQKNLPVLLPIDIEIPDGELFFLLGPSGCGKSTLLRILAGLVEPDQGKIFFDEEEVTRLPAEKRRSSMVFQNYALWPHLTVFENVAFGLRCEGASSARINAEVKNVLEMVKLADFAKRKVTQLSGGQQQRVALARALAVNPRLLLLDEPLSNLDARLRDEMRSEIRRICKERHLTAIYVTHDRNEALSMADRIGVMYQGKIRQTGTPQQIYETPRNCFVASFLGDVNFFEGEVKENKLHTAIGVFPLCGEISAPAGKACAACRPEQIAIVEPGTPGSFPAELLRGIYLGDHSEWVFRTGEQEIAVTEFAPPLRSAGKTFALLPKRLTLVEA